MEWVCKGLLTMASVGLVLALARRWGGSAAGLVAGRPTTTAPALGWMACEHGLRFAADAAAATVAACAMMAAFALAYAHATAGHRPRRVALAWGTAAALMLSGLVVAMERHLLPALAFALACCVIALLAWPARALSDRRPEGAVQLSATMPASAAGITSLCLSIAGRAIATVLAGLLASLPVVSVTVAVAQHGTAGPAAARKFLHGTVAGLFGRLPFGTVFAATLSAFGVAWALGLATVATGAVNLACVRGRALRRQARRTAEGDETHAEPARHRSCRAGPGRPAARQASACRAPRERQCRSARRPSAATAHRRARHRRNGEGILARPRRSGRWFSGGLRFTFAESILASDQSGSPTAFTVSPKPRRLDSLVSTSGDLQ